MWSNLNLDIFISQARAFASGGILKDKREKIEAITLIQLLLSILYAF